MIRVKICGLRRMDDALAAARAGADFLGFVFAPSRRQIDWAAAAEIVAEVRRRASARSVGVFVDQSPAEINRAVRSIGLDFVQLSGREPDDLPRAVDRPVIRTVHVRDEDTPQVLAKRVERAEGAILLVDTWRAGQHGGTGQTFDWAIVPELERPLLLAGGLHAGNVERAIEVAHPWGVDVSGGVETDSAKDPDRIRAFLEAARPNRAPEGGCRSGRSYSASRHSSSADRERRVYDHRKS